jgi:hypothetical protein
LRNYSAGIPDSRVFLRRDRKDDRKRGRRGRTSITFFLFCHPRPGLAPSGCGAVDRSVREKGDLPLTHLITVVAFNSVSLALRSLALEDRLAIRQRPGPAGLAINRPGLRIEGAPQKGPAILEKSLGVAEALLQGGILLLGGLSLVFQGFEPLFQLHQTLGKEVERAGEILGTSADPE